jgi:hypothetical protein
MIEKDNDLWDKPQDYSYMWELEKEPPEDWGFDMRKLTPKQTNLPTTIWIDDTMQFRKEKFSPPIVIVSCHNHGDFDVDYIIRHIPVTISETPKILIPDELFKSKNELSAEQCDNIFKFISRNRDILLAHWNGTLEKDISELLS